MEFNSSDNNNLPCISIDDEISANQGNVPYNVWFIDSSARYSEDCEL